jgi:hypothetical protein
VTVRKDLAFTEKRDGGDRRGEDNSEVDEVPEMENPLEMLSPLGLLLWSPPTPLFRIS